MMMMMNDLNDDNNLNTLLMANTNTVNNAVSSSSSNNNSNKITLDQIASTLLKQNFILTALELHTELAETGREIPRLRDFFSNPANFEQPLVYNISSVNSQGGGGGGSISGSNNNNSSSNMNSSSGLYPLHRASSIQTFDSLDLTRYSDDVDANKFQEDRIAVLEFELRKAKEKINHLRNTLTMATDLDLMKSNLNSSNNNSQSQLIRSESTERYLEESMAKATQQQLTSSCNNSSQSKLKQYAMGTGAVEGVLSSANTITGTSSNLVYQMSDDLGDAQDDPFDTTTTTASNAKQLVKSSINNPTTLMPHDKNAINFLINEYLLEQNYKMTSVTFSEENESLDLEDWDNIGLNRSKPPSIRQLYKLYLSRKCSFSNNQPAIAKPTDLSSTDESSKQLVAKIDSETQTESVELINKDTNTNQVTPKDFQAYVNFDKDLYENQRVQINKLLEKQELFLSSISKLENEISCLNLEKDTFLKKIDSLMLALEKANKSNEALESKKSDGEEYTANELNEIEQLLKSDNADELDQSKSILKEVLVTETTVQIAKDPLVNDKSLELTERKIPAVFKGLLAKLTQSKLDEENQLLLNEISKLKTTNEGLIEIVYKYLPSITSSVVAEKRLALLPLILIAAVQQQRQKDESNNDLKSSLPNAKETDFLKLLFNLIENPNEQQRLMILTCCIQFSKWVGPASVNNELLPQCREQINDKHDEKRMMIAEACSILAPHIYMQMRSSLMFSIVKQMIEHEKCGVVRAYAAKSLSILINYIRDEQKFIQCIELLDICVVDKCELVVEQVEKLMMPSLSIWALLIGRFNNPLIMHLVDKIESNISDCYKHRMLSAKRNDNDLALSHEHESNAKIYLNLLRLNLQFIYSYILINFRDTDLKDLAANSETKDSICSNESSSNEIEEHLSKLNAYYIKLQEKLDIKDDLYKLDSILEDYLQLGRKYLCLIETDTWPTDSAGLSSAFNWLSDQLIIKLIQLSAQVEAKDPICDYFVRFFRDFTLIFSIDYELIKSKVLPIFEKLLSTTLLEATDNNNSQSNLESFLSGKSCPLYKAILPVYFVGILSTLVEVDKSGLANLNSQASSLNGSLVENNHSSISSASSVTVTTSSTIEKMSAFLKNVFFALSLNQSNLDGLVSIYEQMKSKSKSNDYIIQMLLSTLWDGIVHNSLYVRCNTAKLFEILVKDCDEYLLSTRILPALITLANDLDKMVRCSSISPLTCIIENCSNKEILERVYTQLQSFLSDPILKDDYQLQMELLKTFRRISTKVNSKFREEFILPYLAILALQVKNTMDENDYEFNLSSFTSAYTSITSVSSTHHVSSPSNFSLLSSSNSANTIVSNRDASTSHNHQSDIQKICVLLFDTYQSMLVLNSVDQQPIQISRQSIHESLLPGLNCLREILNNNIIIPSASTHNDFLNRIEQIIFKIEQLQHQHVQNSHVNDTLSVSPMKPSSKQTNQQTSTSSLLSATPVTTLNNHSTATDHSVNASPMKSSSSSSINNLANETPTTTTTTTGVNNNPTGGLMSTLSMAITTPIQNGVASELTSNVNSNLKSFVFKGISNFNTSKDKISNLLATTTSKTLKK